MNDDYLLKIWENKEYNIFFKDAKLRIASERAFFILECLRNTFNVPGDLIELGVYKGSTAYLIADFIRRNKTKKKLYLFDTFCGTPAGCEFDNKKREGLYKDVDLIKVKKFLGEFLDFTIFVEGYIPDTFKEYKNKTYSFAHIHLNLYQSTIESLNYLYERLNNRGMILVEDYGLKYCAGVRKSVDDFMKEKKQCFFLEIPTGQGLIIKYENI